MALLSVDDLRTYFYTSRGIVRAVDGVSFQIDKDEILSLVGETGCGKTVTALSIMRLIPYPGKVVRGKVLFKEKDILTLTEEEMRKIRGKEIGMIFQNPSRALNPVYTIGYQVSEMPLYRLNMPKRKAWEIAVDLLKSVKIPNPEVKARNFPHTLSGGMKQRSVIAMMIAMKPNLLIADEPTTALDVTIQAEIMDLLFKIKKEHGMSILLITHNLGLVAEISDKVAIMYAGKIAEIGHVEEVLNDPLHPYTKGLIESIPLKSGRKSKITYIPGTVPDVINPPSGCRFHPRCKYSMEICKKKEPSFTEVEKGQFVNCFLYE